MGLECWIGGHELSQHSIDLIIFDAYHNGRRQSTMTFDCANCHKPIECTYNVEWNNIKKRRIKK